MALIVDNGASHIAAQTGDLSLTAGAGNALNLDAEYVIIPTGGSQNPALKFDADVDTGLFSPEPNSVSFAANGSEVLRAQGPNTWNGAAAALLVMPGTGGVSPVRLRPMQNDPAGNVDLALDGQLAGHVYISDIRMPKATDGSNGQLLSFSANSLVFVDAPVIPAAPTFLAPRVKSVSYSATIDATWDDADHISITLTGNATINMSGAVDGQKLLLSITQDATGGRTVTWGSAVRFGTDLTSTVLSTAGGKTDRVGLIYDATAGKYDVIALARGF